MLGPNSSEGSPGEVSPEGDYGVGAARISGERAVQWGCVGSDVVSLEARKGSLANSVCVLRHAA